MNLLTIVPWYYKLGALALVGIALIGFGWVEGAGHVQNKWNAQKQEVLIKTITIEAKQAEATVKVVTKYIDRIKVIYKQSEVIHDSIPTYVTPKADNACIVPVGFIRLLAAAGSSNVP